MEFGTAIFAGARLAGTRKRIDDPVYGSTDRMQILGLMEALHPIRSVQSGRLTLSTIMSSITPFSLL